jgi:ABC-type glycerol-3-phosphate transport system substrate-binding protein
MPEGTIYEDPNKAKPQQAEKPSELQAENNPETPPKHSVKKFLKIGAFLFVVLTILFIILSILSSRTGSSNEKVTINYWGLKDDPSVYESIISDFEKENPNIDVIYTKQSIEDYREKVKTRIENGSENAPDIFKFHNTWLVMMSDLLLPLPEETVQREEFLNEYYSVSQTDLIKNGAIYGLPLEIDTLALFINTKILEDASREQNSQIKAPSTWQEFIEVSQKLTKRNESGKIEIAGAGIGTFDNVDNAPDIISLLFAQNSVDFEDPEGTSSQASDALKFYTNFSLVENSVWDETLEPTREAFSQGRLGMFFGYSSDYFAIKSSNPNIQMQVVPVPQLLTDERTDMASYWADGISINSAHQGEALSFLKYLSKEETVRRLYDEQAKTLKLGRPYGNKNIAEVLKGSDNFTFVEQAKTAVSLPFVDKTFDNGINQKLNNSLKEAVNAILSNTSPESVVGNIFETYTQAYAEYLAAPTNQ